MRSRFVAPGMVRLPLSGGDYIDIKRQLNVGEERRVFARCVKKMIAGEQAEIDPEQVGKTRVAEFILGWGGPGFVMPDGTPVEFSEAALMDLDAETYAEIMAALNAHEAAEVKLRDAEKNATDGATASGPISPSASS
jgi:hypothetical protein